MNNSTCYTTLSGNMSFTMVLHFGTVGDFENTIVKDFALFNISPLASLSSTIPLIKPYNCSSDSAIITMSSAYLRLCITVPSTLKPSMPSLFGIIFSVYNIMR